MNTYVWSDPHLNHLTLAEKFRPSFGGTIEAHDKKIIDAWNDAVRPEDEVWMIGDVAMGKRSDSVPIYGTLHGRKHLVPGNHDNCHPMFASKQSYAKSIALYSEFFTIHDTIVDAREAIGIPDAILSHFPWLGSYTDHASEGPRGHYDCWHPQFDDYNENIVVIHGHTHSPDVIAYRAVHVGVDAFPNGPISVDILAEVVNGVRKQSHRLSDDISSV